MSRQIMSLAVALLLGLVLSGCDLFKPAEIAKNIEIKDIDALVHQLRLMENDVEIKGEAKQPFLSVAGKALLMNGSRVEAYQYPGSTAVEIDAEKTRESLIYWPDEPHFFKSEYLLVFYVGRNMKVVLPLRRIFGTEFWPVK